MRLEQCYALQVWLVLGESPSVGAVRVDASEQWVASREPPRQRMGL